MSILALNFCCCAVLLLLVNSGESLKCRSGNRQSNGQVHKAMQTCRKKYLPNGSKNGNDYTSPSETDSSDEDSGSSASLDEELFFGRSDKRPGGNNSRNVNNGQSSSGNYGENRRTDDRRKQDAYTNNRMANPRNYTWMNEGGNNMSNQNENRHYHGGMQSRNHENNNKDQRERNECVTQCFFDELNLVDQRGFAERGSVMEIMTRGIQDPNLRDFIEESISECFHYLESDTSNREKCTFSNNLMNCITDKGRDRCEDWDEQ